MKAIVRTRYGSPDVLELQEVEKPVPKDGEVLVQVHAASVNTLDWHIMRGQPFLLRAGDGLRKPKDPRLGVDLAGRVEGVGANVTRFQVGDKVFGIGRGAFAEFACAAENRLALKPTDLSYEAAAAVPIAAVTALQGLRDKGHIRPGEKVLIQGASGGVGTFAVQIAKAFGAEVTAVCSTRNVDQAGALGADHVIDYTQEDFTRKRGKQRQRYDLIVAVSGYHPISAYRRTLRATGRYVLVGASSHLFQALFQALLLGPVISGMGSKKVGGLLANTSQHQQDLAFLKELLESGKVRPVIERRYALSETNEAIRYLEKGHARGKIVITV
ncbi:MAG TPA: NAD(P)-dependent alcohol dehydrogenase [Ktedonobacterales bacterium]|nr:NAD(P)-dependent alcohol dehydrogenase [Ktedonobacterales bacterium]